jgi:ABC-type sugar transport system ATPase subunit
MAPPAPEIRDGVNVPAAVAQPLWELRRISKSFPGVKALDEVSLTLHPGEVHALLGENGSGKSTLCKCLAGVYGPDGGEVLYCGAPVAMADPLEARRYGVATIYQEFSLVPSLSVVENIFLGRPLRHPTLGTLDWQAMRNETVRLLQRLELPIDPDATVRELSVAEQQLVEIAKALALDSTLLIMDEPTAALGLAETKRLQTLIKHLAAQGKAILYVSHRLDEVFAVCDVATIVKDGRLVVARRPVRELTMDAVVRYMVGVDIDEHYPKLAQPPGKPVLEVEGLTTANRVRDVSFTIHAGEVLGLGGMVGAGRTEIARAIFGIDRRTAGIVRLDDREVQFASPAEAIEAGVGYVPENRTSDGLFFNFDAPPNITVAQLKQILRGGILRLGRERDVGKSFVDKLHISRNALDRSVKFLSGGNQQKVVIARWLFSRARLLIFDEPTRGIDIGAKRDVYHVINELTAQGIAILLISSDYPELLAMSDRVAIVRDGRILQIAEGGRLTEHELTAIASGVSALEPAAGDSIDG